MAAVGHNGKGSAGTVAIECARVTPSFGAPAGPRWRRPGLSARAITTIVGPSGCGKTVLLKHLNLLLRPIRARIVIDGVEVTRCVPAGANEVRKKFGMLFQAGALFDSMTVFDNVAFPAGRTDPAGAAERLRAKVHETLAAVGLQGMENKFPSEMSGGMQKRAALARALDPQPKILMLDEPTTGLDPTRTDQIHALVRQTQQRLRPDRGDGQS